jgi:photosystem II stability/assembly factor-like uncharacterized protein
MNTINKKFFLIFIFTAFDPFSNLNAQWRTANGPYGGAELISIVSNGANLFGATADSVYISTDTGINWKGVNLGLPFNPTSPGTRTFFCLGSNRESIFAGTFAGVYSSKNNGASWESINGPNTMITSIGFLDTIIVAGINSMESSGIFRSTDNGISWTRVDSFFTNWRVTCLITKNDTIFAGLYGGGLRRSTDYGKTWAHLDSTGITSNIITGIIVNNNKIYVGTLEGLYCSENNGVSWKRLAEIGMQTLTAIGDNLLIGDGYGVGVYLSTDEGASWIPRNSGFISLSVSFLATFGDKLFATTNEGLFISADTGATWTIVNIRAVKTSVNSIISGDSGTLYAGTDAGFFRSTDKGNNWIAASTGLPTYMVSSVVTQGSNLLAGTDKGIFCSSNGGGNWLPSNNGLDNSNVVYTMTINKSDIFAAGTNDIFKSTDSGESWKALNTGFTMFDMSSLFVTGENIFAGASNGIFKSSDYGLHWAQADSGLIDQHITSLLFNEGKIFAGTYLHGVFSSSDYGTKWSSVPFIFLSNQAVHSLAIYNNTIFFAGTDYGVLAYSLNDSNLISGYNNGLSNGTILSFAVQDSIVFAGTYGMGIWRRSVSELITGVKKENDAIPSEFRLFQNYPNPFNPSTIISFTLPSRSFVSLKVFDLLGREVATIVSEEMPSGSYSRQWNAVNISSGIYFYRLQAGAYTETRKLVILK